MNPTEVNPTEDDGEPQHTTHAPKVLPFPLPRYDGADTGKMEQQTASSQTRLANGTQQVAQILLLPITEPLARLVEEYASLATLSLPGEADAAREWIDDPQRNKKHKHMSPAFFRNWLKREQNAIEQRHLQRQQAAQATGTDGPAPADRSQTGRRPPNLMHLADEDRQRTRGASR